MKERIKLIMEKANLSPAQFADRLQINRAVVSHILNGRNNPSLDVVTKILDDMDYINPEWLIKGVGGMYKEPDLFSQNAIIPPRVDDKTKEQEERVVKKTVIDQQVPDNKIVKQEFTRNKKINQIIIYYDDNTFEIFNPH